LLVFSFHVAGGLIWMPLFNQTRPWRKYAGLQT